MKTVVRKGQSVRFAHLPQLSMDVTLNLLDQLEIPWEIVSRWNGPVWTGDRFVFQLDSYGDLARFHEFMHYCMADEWQLALPDFGLGMNTGSEEGWRSSTWTAPPSEFDDPEFTESWSDEDRVTRQDAAVQEAYAVWTMGLYPMFNPKALEVTHKVMSDFSAWATDGVKWTVEHNLAMIGLVKDPLALPDWSMFALMERWRAASDEWFAERWPEAA